MIIKKISQLNPEWKSILLGNSSSTTMGQAGCLVCAISMLLGLDTPIILNDDKSNFVKNNGNWYWASINKYGGKYIGKYNYTYEKMIELANKYGGVVVGVSTKGNNTQDHYVVYTEDGTVYNSGTSNYDKIAQKGFGSWKILSIYDQIPNKDGKIFNAEAEYIPKSVIEPIPETDSILVLVKKTIRGDFGSGDARKKALGSNYTEVQRQVNLNIKNKTTQWGNIKLY